MADENLPVGLGADPGKNHPCTACGRIFNSKSAHTKHVRQFCKGGNIPVATTHNNPCPNCPKTYETTAGLSQHRRRAHQQEVADEASESCTYCERRFPNIQGVQQHKRHSHPKEYNAEMEKEADVNKDYNRWTLAEVEEMALIEINYEGTKVNKHLATLSKRPIDSIKSKRRSEHYKGVILRLREAQVRGRRTAATPARPLPPNKVTSPFLTADLASTSTSLICVDSPTPPKDTKHRPPPLIIIQTPIDSLPINPPLPPSPGLLSPSLESPKLTPDSASSNSTGPFFGLDSDPVQIHLRQLLELDTGDMPETDRALLIAAINASDDLPANITSWISAHTSNIRRRDAPRAAAGKPNGAKRQSDPKPSRASLYRLAQESYKKNRSGLAHAVIDDTLGSAKITPLLTEVRDHYTQIFGTLSHDDKCPVAQSDHVDSSYRPILQEDLISVLASCKSESSGPDGVSLSNIRRIPTESLGLFFNVILFSGIIPPDWKQCRTILLPKGSASADVNAWRPITISSIFLRIFNRIIARRLADLPLHNSQRGFKNMDGCLANNLILQSTIKHCRKEVKEHHVLTLDLQKAFDTVSHLSIKRALARFNIHHKTAALISNCYSNCTTSIQIGKESTQPIPINRGVKQGDPLSPTLFNMVLDELLQRDWGHLSISLNNHENVGIIAYADDLVLLSSSIHDAEKQLATCIDFFAERGMKVNPKKCTALSARVVPRKKKLYAVTNPLFKTADGELKQILPETQFKYLGLSYGLRGVTLPDCDQFATELSRIEAAPLKPFQKITILKTYLIPRYFYILQNPKISKKLLENFDRLIRISIRKILHLPRSTSNAFLYAHQRDGGLGLTCLVASIPNILAKRVENLRATNDAQLESFLKNSLVSGLVSRLEAISKTYGPGKRQVRNNFRSILDASYCGNGIHQGSSDSGSSSWMNRPPSFWKGGDYVKAIQLKGNLLPTVGIPSNPPAARKCRAGCIKTESLSHVLQGCPATHWERIRRHDALCLKISRAASSRGWSAVSEPRFRLSDGQLRKPDLILTTDSKTVVCEVAVHWEGPRSLASGFNQKLEYYSTPEFLEAVAARYPNPSISVLPILLGARGTWCNLNDRLLTEVGLPLSIRRDLVLSVITGSCNIHSQFGKRVFRR